MTKKHGIYRCNVCGNVVELVRAGAGTLVCCGQPMELLVEKQDEMLNEKHVPEVKIDNGTVNVKVGSVSHPMESGHYIEWIEVVCSGNTFRKFLAPGEKPEASFLIQDSGNSPKTDARAFCNIHGLWKSRG